MSRLFIEKGLDVIAVQESKIESEAQTESVVRLFESCYYVCVGHAVGTSGGCFLFIRKSLGTVTKVVSCESGRLVLCDLSISNSNFRLVCIYAPNNVEERLVFVENIYECLQTDRLVILLGDFNCVCEPRNISNNTR